MNSVKIFDPWYLFALVFVSENYFKNFNAVYENCSAFIEKTVTNGSRENF